jgi:hypothetical protein
MDRVPFNACLHDPRVSALWPAVLGPSSKVLPVNYYNVTLGKWLLNYKVSASPELFDDNCDIIPGKVTCRCHSPEYAPFIDAAHGHVVTANLDIVQLEALRALMKKGTKFRSDNAPVDPLKDVVVAFASFRKRVAKATNIDAGLLIPWCQAIIETITAPLQQACAEAPAILPVSPLFFSMDRALNDPLLLAARDQLRKDFVITFTDKSSTTFALVCKHHYLSTLKIEIAQINPKTNKNTYSESVTESSSEVLSRHKVWLEANKLTFSSSHPYLYGSVKFHKLIPGWRFIAGSCDASLSNLSKWLSRSLKGLMPSFNQLWVDTVSAAGLDSQKSWILQDSTEAVDLIKKLNRAYPRNKRAAANVEINVFDFKTLYTAIPLDDLKTRVCLLINQVFLAKGLSHFHVSTSSSKWSLGQITPDSQNEKNFDANKLCEWICFLIDNIYASFGTKLYKQTIGIPMGTNCAGWLANLYLFSYELDFYKERIATGDLATLRLFHLTGRYMDDLISIDNNVFETFMYKDANGVGIYPFHFLELNKESSNINAAHFLDLSVGKDKIGWFTKVWSKWENTAFKEIQKVRVIFPHPLSAISRQAKYGIVTSQLHRFDRNCTRTRHFIDASSILLSALINKGYSKHTLLHKTNHFCRRFIHHFDVANWRALCAAIDRGITPPK